MERLIHVGLRHGDIILETAGDRRVHLMDDAQGRIAVLHSLHNNPHREQVVDLIQCLLLIHHFLVNAEEMLDPSADLRLDSRLVYMLFHVNHNLIDKPLSFILLLVNLMDQVVIGLRLKVLQRQVIQLHFDLGNTQALRDGRIDIHGFSGLFLLLLRRHIFQRPHIVKTVSQLHKNHPYITGHGQEHLPQILRLLLNFVRRIIQLAQLGNAVHQKSNLTPELAGQLFLRHDGVFHHIMKKAGSYTLLVKLQIRQDNRHTQRMDDIRFS